LSLSEYYQNQFVLYWKGKTKGHSQGPNTMSFITALLIERGGDINVVVLTAGNVVVLTAGTRIKHKIMYLCARP